MGVLTPWWNPGPIPDPAVWRFKHGDNEGSARPEGREGFCAAFAIVFSNEIAFGHPCLVVSVTYVRRRCFTATNTGSNPVADANPFQSCADLFRTSRKVVANQTMELTIPLIFTIDESFDIGADTRHDNRRPRLPSAFQLHRQDRQADYCRRASTNSRPRMYKNWSRQRSVRPTPVRTGLSGVPLT